MDFDQFEYWASHPADWIKEFLGARLWAKQVEVCEALVDYNYVACRSGHGVGKSFVCACLVLWYLFTHYNSKIITTAPSFQQCKMILWSEIGKLHQQLKERITYAGELTQTGLRLGAGWWAVARSTDQPNNFIGAHEENLLVVFDEATGISRELFDAAKGVVTGKHNKIVMIGNPTDPTSYFADVFRGEIPGYKTIKISVFDSPNIRRNPITGQWEDAIDPTTNELPYPALSSLKWVEEMRQTYGEKSAAWSAKVLGEFPEDSTDSLISGKHLAAAVQKGIYLRKIIAELEEGSRILSGDQIRQIVGRE